MPSERRPPEDEPPPNPRVRHLLRRLPRVFKILVRLGKRRLLYGPQPPQVEQPEIRRPSVPVGIEFVYQTAQDKLSQQLAAIDQLDTKAGVLIGALGAAIGVFISFGKFTHDQKTVLAAMLIVATAFATYAFSVRKYEDAPNPSSVVILGMLSPNEIKTLTLQDVLDAKSENEPKLVLKGRLINASVAVAGLAILYAFLAHVV